MTFYWVEVHYCGKTSKNRSFHERCNRKYLCSFLQCRNKSTTWCHPSVNTRFRQYLDIQMNFLISVLQELSCLSTDSEKEIFVTHLLFNCSDIYKLLISECKKLRFDQEKAKYVAQREAQGSSTTKKIHKNCSRCLCYHISPCCCFTNFSVPTADFCLQTPGCLPCFQGIPTHDGCQQHRGVVPRSSAEVTTTEIKVIKGL